MPLDLYKNTNASLALIITVASSSGDTYRYTTQPSALTVGGSPYLPLPESFVELDTFSGSMDEDNAQVFLPLSASLYSELLIPSTKPSMVITVQEVDVENTASIATLHVGLLATVTFKPKGMDGFVGLLSYGPKSITKNSIAGLICYTSCTNTFGDMFCGKDLNILTETRTVVSISKNTIVLDGADPATVDYFSRGNLYVGGMSIFIKSANLKQLICDLPYFTDTIIGATVQVAPGCDRQLSTCRNKWNNEARFKALGKSMPGYSPYIGNLA